MWSLLSFLLTSGATVVQAAEESALRIEPATLSLRGHFAQGQLVVCEGGAPWTDRTADLTKDCVFESSAPTIADVLSTGRVLPRGNGTATITVRHAAGTGTATVTVSEFSAEPVIDFLDQVRPVLTKSGCALAACHAAQHGQGGFKLTVFGFDPDADRTAMAREAFGRRVNLLAPEDSLLLRKPTMQTPHSGGRRLEPGSRDYQLLAAWVRNGAPGPRGPERAIRRLAVTPPQRRGEPGLAQQLRVEAHYADGEVRDVTAWARFDSMDEGVVTVTRDGACTVTGRGQAPVMARFEGQAEICTFVIPYGPPATLADWQGNNFVDELAATKFTELGIEPSSLCDDATFLRRLFLDVSGTLPAITEVREFLADPAPDKRARWIDRVLGLTDHPQRSVYNERYAAYWTLKWSDLLRNNSRDLQDQGMWSLHNWIRGAFRENVPFDQFVSQLVQGKGSVFSNGPANYFLVNKSPTELAESTAQLFLGVRLQCAQCHHHPFEKYGQDDYYAFAAFFARVGIKNSQEFGLFGGERVILARTGGEVRQPRTNQVMKPKPLDAEAVEHPLDRRIALAEWLSDPKNSGVARSLANRYVSYLLGRGLVEPVDDLRATNPPTNVALLDALTQHVLATRYDLKQLLRVLLNSRIYQLDSQPTAQNAADTRFYSHFPVKRLTAEPLLDAIDYSTGTQTKFKDLPLGTRAIEIPDAEYPDFFLNTFAKPRRTSVCECERPLDPNLAQALHTLNGEVISGKIADGKGRLAGLLAKNTEHAVLVDELYLATLCRPATNAEMAAAEQFVKEAATPKEGYEDLLWALLNSKGYLFVR